MNNTVFSSERECAAEADRRSMFGDAPCIDGERRAPSPTDALIAPANNEAATYRVRISPLPCVVDADGDPVADAQILEIRFPGETMETPAGPRNVIVGAGVAKIMVRDTTLRGVLLC